jgi:phenylalanyl-tRNA synthetase beta chain
MLVSWNWLSDYVSISESVESVTDRLTMSGLNLEEYRAVGGDVCIDLEVTSNRADCLGHLGVAREISALFDTELSTPFAEVQSSGVETSSETSVAIDCADLCHEYHARLIKGVKIGPSPAWLIDRLAAIGINTVNNVVDVTNYVMFECGQPLHAFDFDALSEGRIVVRRARNGESITAIDQKKYELPTGSCVIADSERAIAIAGVMGGLDSEISDKTVHVLIEAASFDPVSVRTTARTLKLHSPSSYRFERRIDRSQLDWASRRCCELILQVAGGKLLNGAVVAGDLSVLTARTIPLRFSQVERILGIDVPREECLSILKSLGVQCVEARSAAASFLAPSWRADLTRECDLIEEVARIHGYDEIPEDVALPVVVTSRSVREQVGDTTRDTLTACGVNEAMTLSFVSGPMCSAVRPRGDIPPIVVNHSSRSHENHLRQSLIPSLLQCRRLNERHGNPDVALFEVAKVYLSADKQVAESKAEPTVLGIVSGGSFGKLKGIIESLASAVAPNSQLDTQPASEEFMAPGRGARITLNHKPLGWIAELNRSVLDGMELQDAAVAAEIDIHLLEECFEGTRTCAPLPRFPSMSRDLNFVLPESTAWSALVHAVRDSGGAWLQQITFGGQYRGSQIGANRKSYIVTCRFAAEDRTLKTDEVDAAVADIVQTCESQLTASLRA